jgi:hypothetical protein
VLIIVAIGAEVFPVAAIGWIIVVVTVAVMHGQEMEIGLIELAGAFGADPSV